MATPNKAAAMTPDELRDWLQDKPREFAIAMAFRSAARVFPAVVGGEGSAQVLTLVTLRCLLISSVAAPVPTDDIKVAAARASDTAHAATATSAARANAARIASARASDTARVTRASDIDAARIASARAASAASAAAYATFAAAACTRADAAFLDANEGGDVVPDLLASPLWPQDDTPLQAEWSKSRARLEKWQGFAFWIDWYEGLLQGRAQNWDMLRDIALIEPVIWEAGAEAVAVEIAKIEARYVQQATPLAEDIIWNPERRRLHVVPKPITEISLFNTILNTLRNAVADMRAAIAASNSLYEMAGVLPQLDRLLAQYADDPQQVHDDMLRAILDIDMLLVENPNLDHRAVRKFRNMLEFNATNVRAWVPDVEKAVRARTALQLREMSDLQQQQLRTITAEIVAISDGDLAKMLPADLELVLDNTVPSDDPKRVMAAHRYASRASRAIAEARRNGVTFVKSGSEMFGIYTFAEKAGELLARLIGL